MRLRNLTIAILSIATSAFCNAANAQFRSYYSPRYRTMDPIRLSTKKPFQRYAVGLTYVPLSGTVSYSVIDEFGTPDSARMSDTKGYGAGVTYAIILPCARVGAKGIAAVHIGINANFYSMNVDKVAIQKTIGTYSSTINYSGGGGGFMFGLPVGVDFISGGEATLDRKDRFSFVLGGGIFPLMGIGIVNEFGGINFKAPPYVKAELGFHFGVNWKLRATYITQSAISFTDNGLNIMDGHASVSTSLKANDQWLLSLLVQPFSFGWE